MRSSLLITPLLAFAAATAVGAGTLAAFTAATESSGNEIGAGTVELYDNDGNQQLVTLEDAAPGASVTGCMRVASGGSLPSLVRLRTHSAGDLLPYLRVKITRGTSTGPFNDCDAFTPDPVSHHGLGAGVMYDGPLGSLAPTWGTALRDPSARMPATSTIPLMAARSGLVGLWELGEVTWLADDFSGAPETLLSAHPELARGGAWTRSPISPDHAVLTRQGSVASRTGGLAVYTQSANTNAQVASATIRSRGGSGEAGLVTRSSANGNSGYLARYRATDGTWELGRLQNGAVTTLGTWVKPLPVGREARLALRQNDSGLVATITAHDGVTHQLTSSDAVLGATTVAAIRVSGDTELDDYRLIHPGLPVGVPTVGSAQATGNAPAVAGAQASSTDVAAGAVFSGTQQLTLSTPGLGNAITVGGWFRLDDGASVMRDNTTGTQGWALGFDDGSGTLKYRVAGSAFDTGVPVASLRNTWRHHALVRDGADVRYFLDGRLVHSATVPASAPSPASPWYVMRDGLGGSYSTGRADQIGVWNRAVGSGELSAIRDGAAGSAAWIQGDAHWYRIHVSVSSDSAAAGRSASAAFTWEARSR